MGKFWKIVGGKRVRTAAGVKHEYEKFESSTKAKKARASRNKARRRAIASGKAHVGDGTAEDHINSNPMDDAPGNIRQMSRSENAGRHEDSREKGSKRNKARWGMD